MSERQESEIPHMQFVRWSVGLRISAQSGDPGNPVIETSLSNAEDVGLSIPTCLVAKKPKRKTEAILQQIQ